MTADRDTETAPERANARAASPAPSASRGKMTKKHTGKGKSDRSQERTAATTAPSIPPTKAATVQETAKAPEPLNASGVAKPAEVVVAGEFDTAAENLAKLVDQGRRVMAAAMSAPDLAETRSELAVNVADATKTLGVVAEYWMTQPERATMAQADLISGLTDIWSQTLHRFSGEEAPPVVPPAPAPGAPAPKPPTPPPGVPCTTPVFTPRKKPPALVRKMSVSAMGKL